MHLMSVVLNTGRERPSSSLHQLDLVGDQVPLIAGTTSPMIARRHEDDTYRLICPAHVHRVMDGEKRLASESEGPVNLIVR